MGAMNGDELAIKLRQLYPGLPLIVVSAVEELPASLLQVVDGRVRKGQTPEKLLAKVSEVLRRSNGKAGAEQPGATSTILCVDDEELQ